MKIIILELFNDPRETYVISGVHNAADLNLVFRVYIGSSGETFQCEIVLLLIKQKLYVYKIENYKL